MATGASAIDPALGDLEFGMFDWLDVQPGVPIGETYESRLRLIRLAEDVGITRYHLAEHHGTPLGLAPSPAVFLAAAARETSTIRLAATTFIVPLTSPLRLAEELGMLDQLSGGRLEIGVGRGSSPIESAMFGVDADEAATRFHADWPAILDALQTGSFTWPVGTPGLPTEPIELSTIPLQRPHPPLWYPTSNPDSIGRLADEGFNVLFGFGFVSPPLEVIREHAERFFARRAELAAHGSAGEGSNDADSDRRFGMLRHVYVESDDAEALATARSAFATHTESFTHLWRAAGSDRFSQPFDVDDLVDRHLLFVGSATSVAEQIAHAVRESRVNYVAGAFAWGSLTESQSAASMTRFADDVVPAIRASLAAI